MSKAYNIDQITFEEDGYSFLKIGKEADQKTLSLEDFKNSKYQKIDSIWGTLGWANGNHLAATGTIEFSFDGNVEHRGVTAEIAGLLKDQNVEIQSSGDIKERFIDLSKIEFQNTPKYISSEEELQLRFDLFIDKSDGALVYLQENPGEDYNSEEAEIHLITPDSTDSQLSQDRYRLSYQFTYTFGKELEYRDEKIYLNDLPEGAEVLSRYTLKVLTFPRKESDFKQYMNKASKELSKPLVGLAHKGLHKLGEKKYQLYTYKVNGNEGSFTPVSGNSIDPTKKTLLLIHGTFSSVEGSFSELCQLIPGETSSLFTSLISDGKFEQIIAFDHPTASHSVEDNAKWLLDALPSTRFTVPVHVITTSRGALIAEYLTANPIAFGKFQIKKVLMFAPAHGSDLLKVAKGMDRLMSLLRKITSKTGWGYVLAMAQFSITAIRTQPGLDIMMPGSERLEAILKLNPIDIVHFKAMVGDYDGSLVEKKFKRWFSNGLDKLLWLAFKSENDWVIGCPEQRKQLHGTNAKYMASYEYKCIHGKQFDPSHPQQNDQPAHVRTEIINYFA